jgi:uncharacterized protein (TIRG00374 family)
LSETRQRRLGRALVRLVGPALLVLVIARMKDPRALLHALGHATLWPIVIAVLLNVVNIHLKVVRWDVILRTRGIHYPRRRAWSSFMTSLYVGLLTPGRVGDILRAQYLRHDLDVPYAEGIASVVVDRLCDLYVLVGFVAVGVVRYAPVIAGRLAVVTWAGVAATALGPLVLLIPGVAERVLGRAFKRLAPGDDGAGFTRFLEATRASVGKPLLVTLPLTVATFFVNYLQGWLIARAMGLPMTFLDASCLLSIASLLGLLPISVSGMGVRELFFALAFPMLGFSPADGVVFGLLVFFVVYLIIVAIGFVSWQISPPPTAPTGAVPLDMSGKVADEPAPVLQRVRSKLREFAATMDAYVARLGHLAVVLFFWPVVYAATIGAGIFELRHLSWLTLIDTNKVPTGDTVKMVLWTIGTFVALVLVYLGTMLVRRLRTGASGGLGTMEEVNRRLRPLLALPILPALTHAAIERDSPKETFFLIALCALAVGAGAYAWLRPATAEGAAAATYGDVPDAPPPRRNVLENLSQLGATVAVAALWAAYGTFFSWLSIVNHHALNTRTTDLGYYDNIFFQSIHGHPLACSFIKAGYHGSAHFDPLLVLLSPIYLAYPRAELLLGLQAVWLGAGVVPAYLLARTKLGSRLAGVVVAAMYAMYPALHGANMYEFHSLTLLSPIVLALLYFLEIGAYKRYYLTLIPALLCREDVALLMCFVGAYAIYQQRAGHRPGLERLGWVTIVVSLVYFAIVKRFFMTSADIFMSGKDSYSFAYYYDDLIPNHNGVAGILLSLVTNPMFVLRTMLTEAKLLYLLTLFLPLGFLPFLARPGRVMLLYGMLFCLLASRSAVFSVHFQYSSVITPIAFALVPVVLKRVQDGDLGAALGLDGRRLSGALLAGALAASLLVSWKFGGIIDNQTFKGGFVRVARGLTDKDRETYAWIHAATAKIPTAASVGLTNRTGAHASNRMRAYFYPEHQNVDYLFIDEAELKGAELDKHTKNVTTGAFVLVERRDKLAVFKKK